MNNKKDLQEQYNNLEKEMFKLKKQINKCDEINAENITYEKACEILREKEYDKSHFLFEHQWYEIQLATVIKALNYLDNNNKVWTLNWNNTREYKYRNWFERKISGWVWFGCLSDCSDSLGPAWLYFKKYETGVKAVKNNTILDLYSKISG